MNETNQIVPVQQNQLVNPDEIMKYMPIAAEFAKSGLFQEVKTAAQAFAVIQYGMEVGLSPIASLQNINIIKGKLSINTQAALTLASRRGVTWKTIVETLKECIIMFRKGKESYESKFTYEMAVSMGLTVKDNWKKQPQNMLYCRAAIKGVRRIDPQCMMGLYTAEELNLDEHQGFENAKQVDAEVVPEANPKDEFTAALRVTKFDGQNSYKYFSLKLDELGTEYKHDIHFVNSHVKYINDTKEGDFESACDYIKEQPDGYSRSYLQYVVNKLEANGDGNPESNEPPKQEEPITVPEEVLLKAYEPAGLDVMTILKKDELPNKEYLSMIMKYHEESGIHVLPSTPYELITFVNWVKDKYGEKEV